MAKAKYTKDSKGYFQTKVWDGTYNPDGSKHRITLRSSKSSRDLENKVNEMNNQIHSRQYVRKSDIPFITYCREWVKVYKYDRSLNTKQMYNNIIEKHLIRITCNLDQLSRAQYVSVLNDTPGARTKQQLQLTMSQIVRSAIKDKLLPESAMSDILDDVPKAKYKSPERRALYDYERAALKKANFELKDKAFVYLLYGCGLRRQEALALSRFDVDMKRREVSVNKAICFDQNDPLLKSTKNNVNRIVPIPDSVFPVLEEHISTLRGTILFPMRNGESMSKSSYRKMWDRILKSMNEVSDQPIVGLTAHIFRHDFCASLCYQIPNISINKIAELLGDDPRMVVDVYNHEILEKEKPVETIAAARVL